MTNAQREWTHGLDEWTDGYIDACDEIFGILSKYPVLGQEICRALAFEMGLSDAARAKYGLSPNAPMNSAVEVPASTKPKGDH